MAPDGSTAPSPPALQVEPVTADAAAAIMAIARALPQWFDDHAQRAIPIDVLHQRGFVAKLGNEITGFLLYYVHEASLVIAWMGVAPERHRAGIGRRLVEAAVAEARRLGLDGVSTWTLGESVEYPPYEATRRFYRGCGFHEVMRVRTTRPECPEELRLRIDLRDRGR